MHEPDPYDRLRPANPSAEYWRRCLDGQGLHFPLFIPATARPGRDAEWLARKRKEMLANQFRRSTPSPGRTRWRACRGSRSPAKTSTSAAAIQDTAPTAHRWPLGQAQLGFPRKDRASRGGECRYLIACDIGVKDATVIVVLDVTSDVQHVAHYERHLGLSYPEIGQGIADVGRVYYPAPVVIESNAWVRR